MIFAPIKTRGQTNILRVTPPIAFQTNGPLHTPQQTGDGAGAHGALVVHLKFEQRAGGEQADHPDILAAHLNVFKLVFTDGEHLTVASIVR